MINTTDNKDKQLTKESGVEMKWYQDKKTGRKIAALILGTLIAAAALVISVYILLSRYQESMVDAQCEQMLSLARSVANSIQVYVEEYEKDLMAESLSSSLAEMESEALAGNPDELTAWLQTQMDAREGDLALASLTLPDGTVLRSTEIEETESIRTMSGDGDAVTIRLVCLEDDTYCLCLSAQTEVGGELAFYLDVLQIYEQTASYITLGEEGYVMIKDSDGLILMHPVEEQIGLYAVAGRQALYPDLDYESLEEMIAQQMSGEEGITIYDSYWWAEDPPTATTKVSAYSPAQIGDDFLIISAVIDYSELTVPVSSGAYRILAVAGVLGTIVLVMFFALFIMIRRERRIEQENAYLKQVNEQLEELRKREERMSHQQRLQLIGTMTGGIAHEFNNLLTPIMGYASLLLAETPEEDEKHQDLQEIYDSAEKAKEITDQLTQFSGKNAEKTFRSISLTQVIDKAMVMAASVKPKNVTIETDLEKRPCTVLGNPTQIQQIILNLCNNAFHAMRGKEHGLLRLESTLMKPDRKKDPFFKGKEKKTFYRLSIRDNGCGMDAETLEQIFVPFFTTKKSGEGTGLGLSIVQRIAENHGGLLCVRSEPGEGTEFILYLPIEEDGPD